MIDVFLYADSVFSAFSVHSVLKLFAFSFDFQL